MRSIDEPKSNGQRLYEAFKKIKRHGMGVRPYPNLRPSEMMMLHSILHCLKAREKDGECKLESCAYCRDVSAENENKAAGVTVSELSEFTRMTSSAVSQTVKALEEKGFIERTISPQDRRIVFVHVSEKGYQIFREAEESFMCYLDTITKALGEEDTSQLINLLEKLADVLPPVSK